MNVNICSEFRNSIHNEKIYNKPAFYDLIKLKGSFEIRNINLTKQIFHNLELIKEDYYESKLIEYYG